MAGNGIGRVALALCAALALQGCEDGTNPFAQPPGGGAVSSEATVRTVERDIEAPDVFQATEDGLWDGRPSLGGVWVAYPDVRDPERVIIRNETNGQFVIGALFNRERENPGPKLQVSSDAAAAIGLLAGQPTPLNVTALRKEEVPVAPPVVAEETQPLEEPEAIETATLEPLAAAAAAIDKAEAAAKPAGPKMAVGDIQPAASTEPLPIAPPAAGSGDNAVPAAAAPAAPAPKPVSSLKKPFIQIGIYSVESNANRTGDALRKGGVLPTVLKQSSSGKTFWRVVVGPARSSSERAALLKKVKELGYTDAYSVTN